MNDRVAAQQLDHLTYRLKVQVTVRPVGWRTSFPWYGTNKHICGYKYGLIVVMVVLGYGMVICLENTVNTIS